MILQLRHTTIKIPKLFCTLLQARHHETGQFRADGNRKRRCGFIPVNWECRWRAGGRQCPNSSIRHRTACQEDSVRTAPPSSSRALSTRSDDIRTYISLVNTALFNFIPSATVTHHPAHFHLNRYNRLTAEWFSEFESTCVCGHALSWAAILGGGGVSVRTPQCQ